MKSSRKPRRSSPPKDVNQQTASELSKLTGMPPPKDVLADLLKRQAAARKARKDGRRKKTS